MEHDSDKYCVWLKWSLEKMLVETMFMISETDYVWLSLKERYVTCVFVNAAFSSKM